MNIEIKQAEGRYRVHLGGVVLGETAAALALHEGARAPVLYVPRADMDMGLLVASPRVTRCTHKGAASYFGIKTPEGLSDDLVWSYEDPTPGCAAIAGHLAFYPEVTVERLG